MSIWLSFHIMYSPGLCNESFQLWMISETGKKNIGLIIRAKLEYCKYE